MAPRPLAVLLWLASSAAAQPVTQLHLKVAMRDGVRLCTNVFRPSASGRFPAVLHRTPYRKVSALTPGLRAFLDHGYAVVTQDVRGRYDSEGAFQQVTQETADGADTLSWIALQPWSDGRVAMFGGSYVAIAQWRAALSGHPALKAIAPAVSGGDEYFDRYYSRGGAFRLAHRLRWIAENFKPPRKSVVDFQRMITFLPLANADRLAAGRTLDFYQAAMAHPAYDGYWRALSTRLRAGNVQAAAFIEAGWYDSYAQSDLEMWSALRARGRPARLVIGPWGHNLSPEMPGAAFGPAATLPLRGLEIEWFDAWLKHDAPPPSSAVHYFLMGAGQWRESPVWPPAALKPLALYLDARRGANSLHGDGRLLPAEPDSGGADRYVYDPRKAVPTLGGANCCNPKIFPWGPLDQRPVEGRHDVLVYSSAPLRSPLEITGEVRAILYVASSAPDTDFTAKLVDVDPSGAARILCDGLIRLRYREGVERPAPYRPGRVERIEVDLGPTAFLFSTGHRLRLEVSSSNFPRFDRNLNTGRILATETQLRQARQHVFHGPPYSSHLVLPVIQHKEERPANRLLP